MKLSTKGQYAIQAMMKLAINFNSSPVTLAEISKSQTISLSYLEQLFSMLRDSGLVQGVRGPGGGYRLSRSPNKISIANIIFAVEESTNDATSKKHLNCTKGDSCISNYMWNEFSQQLSVFLESISLGDIIKEQVVIKSQFKLDETTRQIATMFPVTKKLMVA